jgi:hypothetical protein
LPLNARRDIFSPALIDRSSELHDSLLAIITTFEEKHEQTLTAAATVLPRGLQNSALKIRDFAERIYSFFSCEGCDIQGDLEARLRLGSYSSILADTEVPSHLCVLLMAHDHSQIWYETAIHMSCSAGDTRQRVMFQSLRPEAIAFDQWFSSNPKVFRCFCKTMAKHARKNSSRRMNLTLDSAQSAVEYHRSSTRIYLPNVLESHITLKSLLEMRDKNWTGTTKLALSLILIYSLYYLSGSPWAKERWSRKNIIFFRNGDEIALRPFLRSDPAGTSGPLSDEDEFHRHPEVFELGVILLEVHIGQSLEAYLGIGRDISTYDGLFDAACNVFRSEDQNIMLNAYRRAIENCFFHVEDAIEDMGEGTPEDRLRMWLLKEVLIPIETDVRTSFGRFISVDRLDEEAEKFNLAPHTDRNNRRADPSREASSVCDMTITPGIALREKEKQASPIFTAPLRTAKRRRQDSGGSYNAPCVPDITMSQPPSQQTRSLTATAVIDKCSTEPSINQSAAGGTQLKRYAAGARYKT